MNQKMERPVFIHDLDPLTQGSTLVVGINTKGKISRFNETLEQLTGTSKKDALDVPFASYFSKQIPQDELEKLLRQAKYNPESVDIETSFQTVTGENVVVNWIGFTIKDENDGRVSQLNLVGTPLKTFSSASSRSESSTRSSSLEKQGSSKKPSTEEKKSVASTKTKKEDDQGKKPTQTQSEPIPVNVEDIKKDNSTPSKKKTSTEKQSKKPSTTKQISSHDEELTVKEKIDENNLKKNVKKPLTKKRIRIKRRSSISRTKIPKDKHIQKELTHVTEKTDSLSTDSLSAEERNELYEPHFLQRWFPTPSFKKKTISREYSRYFPKISLFSKTQKQSQSAQGKNESNESSEHELTLQKMIGDLQKENSNLQKQIQSLEKDIQDAELKKNELKEFFNRKFRFIRDSISIKKKREEFQLMMEQLNERKQKLETLETEMILEKKEFKQKIEEFVTWREKLESLEQEIEKRREFLSEQEAFLNEQYDKVLSHELMQPASYTQSHDNIEEKQSSDDPGILEKDDLFNALTVEAAVLQRGRIKKANKLFAQMLGYPEDEIVGKHLVDFVGPNGLAGVEQHYMNRLKGVDDSSYKTVFLSKDDHEVTVKVHVKTSDFQGERAEIVTFNEV